MHFSTIFALAVAFGSGAQVAQAAPTDSAPKTMGNYSVVPLQWYGQVFPNGPNITLERSLDHIYVQIKKMNPDYKHEPVSTGDQVTRRFNGYILCNRSNFWNAAARDIISGEAYLSGVGGLCLLPAGAGYCGRVSCSYAGAIFFWNDAPHSQYINCAEIASYSRPARQQCTNGNGGATQFNSQNFNTDTGYSVLDAWGNC